MILRWPAPDDALLNHVVFSLERTAIREVAVGGEFVIREGRHPLAEEIIREFAEVQRDVWGADLKSAADYLLDLVAIPSVSSMSNRPVIEYALGQLDPKAWTTKLYPYRDAAGIEKVNLVAILQERGAGGRHPSCPWSAIPIQCRSIPGWNEAVHPKVRNGKLYGRGSCDVKGFLACILAVVSDLDVAACPSRWLFC